MGGHRGSLCGTGAARHASANDDNGDVIITTMASPDFLSWAAPAWLSPMDSSPGCPGGGADAGTCLPATRQGARRQEGKGTSEQMDHWAALPLGSLALEHAAWGS